MKKTLTLVNKNDNQDKTQIMYKTTSKTNTGIISLLMDLIAFVFFDWWWFILTIIFTTIFSIKRYQKIDSVVSNVRMLISAGFQPEKEEDARVLIKDFKIHPKLITNFLIEEIEGDNLLYQT